MNEKGEQISCKKWYRQSQELTVEMAKNVMLICPR